MSVLRVRRDSTFIGWVFGVPIITSHLSVSVVMVPPYQTLKNLLLFRTENRSGYQATEILWNDLLPRIVETNIQIPPTSKYYHDIVLPSQKGLCASVCLHPLVRKILSRVGYNPLGKPPPPPPTGWWGRPSVSSRTVKGSTQNQRSPGTTYLSVGPNVTCAGSRSHWRFSLTWQSTPSWIFAGNPTNPTPVIEWSIVAGNRAHYQPIRIESFNQSFILVTAYTTNQELSCHGVMNHESWIIPSSTFE